jgi:hypothetical protein
MMSWLLLILTLPTENATARMRAWRALKASGAAVLRDGVYLLPLGDNHRQRLAEIAADVSACGGTTYLLDASGEDYSGLFNRGAEYQQLDNEIATCRIELDKLPIPDLQRQLRKLRKHYEGVGAIDFFPGEAKAQIGARLDDLEATLRNRLSPDEPSSSITAIERRDPAAYVNRTLATRKRPWIDRLASAWLIRRFIDRRARLLWLDSPADCPADALGFDFDGASFSHNADKVTFETLMTSFGLDLDPALQALARVIHYLDVGGLPVAEAAGLEAMLGGMRSTIADDDALLDAASGSLDYLYAHYLNGEAHK